MVAPANLEKKNFTGGRSRRKRTSERRKANVDLVPLSDPSPGRSWMRHFESKSFDSRFNPSFPSARGVLLKIRREGDGNWAKAKEKWVVEKRPISALISCFDEAFKRIANMKHTWAERFDLSGEEKVGGGKEMEGQYRAKRDWITTIEWDLSCAITQ